MVRHEGSALILAPRPSQPSSPAPPPNTLSRRCSRAHRGMVRRDLAGQRLCSPPSLQMSGSSLDNRPTEDAASVSCMSSFSFSSATALSPSERAVSASLSLVSSRACGVGRR